jgi:hypothetical protein
MADFAAVSRAPSTCSSEDKRSKVMRSRVLIALHSRFSHLTRSRLAQRYLYISRSHSPQLSIARIPLLTQAMPHAESDFKSPPPGECDEAAFQENHGVNFGTDYSLAACSSANSSEHQSQLPLPIVDRGLTGGSTGNRIPAAVPLRPGLKWPHYALATRYVRRDHQMGAGALRIQAP